MLATTAEYKGERGERAREGGGEGKKKKIRKSSRKTPFASEFRLESDSGKGGRKKKNVSSILFDFPGPQYGDG